MKTMLFAAAASVVALAAMPAAAQDIYGQIGAGLSLESKVDVKATASGASGSQDFDLDKGWLLGGAVGTTLGPVRGEVEVFYTHNEISDSYQLFGSNVDVNEWAGMANVIYDVPVGSKVTPYVGAGLGYGRTTLKVGDEDEGDGGLAWQLKAGVTVHGADGVNFDVGYRYVRLATWEAEADLGDGPGQLKVEPSLHVIGASVRFPFGGAK